MLLVGSSDHCVECILLARRHSECHDEACRGVGVSGSGGDERSLQVVVLTQAVCAGHVITLSMVGLDAKLVRPAGSGGDFVAEEAVVSTAVERVVAEGLGCLRAVGGDESGTRGTVVEEGGAAFVDVGA